MGWGGARVGAGRKPKDAGLHALPGRRGRRRAAPPPDAPVAPERVDAPAGLELGQALVWVELAPLALEQRTLTRATAQAFALLCQNIAIERNMRLSPLTIGGPDHRGMVRIVEIGMARFLLNATGKPTVAPEKPKDDFAEFDQPLTIVQGGKKA